MANINATWLYKTGLLTIKGTNTGTSVNDLIGLTTPETILSVLNSIAYGDSKKIMMEIGSFNANVVNYGNFYKYQLGYSNSSNGNEGKFIIQGCPVSTTTYTNTDPPVTLLQLSKANLALSVPIQFQVNTWNTSSDGKARFFFSSSNRTHFGSPNGYSFRNETDAFDILVIDTVGNILMGNNTALQGTTSFPIVPAPKLYSGTDAFNNDGGKYMAGVNLALEAQSIVDPGGKAYGASILLEAGREAQVGPGWRVDGAIKFTTGGSERLRVTNDGLYIFSGNVPVRLQTRYINATPGYDCMFEINTNYNRLTNTVDSPFYGTASLQVNSSQSEGGYISIATGGKNTAPTEVVKVVGSNMNVVGDIYSGGNVTAYSDIKLKDNIITLNSPLEKILKMRGVYYTRKNDPRNLRQIGVIAQEIEEICPELVVTDSTEDKNKSVAYGNIVALLIEGIKAQQSTIDFLLKNN